MRAFAFLVILTASLFCFSADGNLGLRGLKYTAEDSETNLKTGHVKLIKVKIEYRGMKFSADELNVNFHTKDFIAIGNVHLHNEEADVKGHQAYGNFAKRVYNIGKHDGKQGPWIGKADSFNMNPGKFSVAHNVYFTTCNKHGRPHYHITARKIMYTEEKGFQAYNVWFTAGRVPVLWLPYYQGRIQSDDGAFEIRPGYSSKFGAYALIARRFELENNNYTTFMMDILTKKGVAFGNRTEYKTKRNCVQCAEKRGFVTCFFLCSCAPGKGTNLHQ